MPQFYFKGTLSQEQESITQTPIQKEKRNPEVPYAQACSFFNVPDIDDRDGHLQHDKGGANSNPGGDPGGNDRDDHTVTRFLALVYNTNADPKRQTGERTTPYPHVWGRDPSPPHFHRSAKMGRKPAEEFFHGNPA
jgi:hypothetical protein